MTGRALTAALVLCGLAATACGGAPDDTGAVPQPATGSSATSAGSASPAETTAGGSPDGTETSAGSESPDGSGTAEALPEGAAPEDSAEATVSGTAEAPATGGAAGSKPLEGKVVVIDPGHNENNHRHTAEINRQVDVLTQRKACDTTGTTTASGYTEAAFTWDVSQHLARILKARGATVKLTRSGSTPFGPCITQRAAIGNRARADAAISVHADGSAAGNRGFHVIMPRKINGPVDPVVGRSEQLGIAVRNAFREGTGLPYSTYIGRQALDYRSDLGGLNLSTVPKVFIECGNMKNRAEAAKFQDARFRQRIALALADGIQDYLR
ncbi:N-acetylmuramoyl-L-alanine amidase [Planobispora rosea]|uniref:N-acetylmuramoyl-L-alanine amidase n=1 Tax=Planobispora rosea TaxID=35762 RepID=A0A8J3S6E6_PLARO|nr:N-acetylmuramoyl-L-alanine amidase [Planobispora rosea]GGS96680.1 N-acetylmuramoyl-L-alanine amidase [Planobispora rosea]GIH87659.1 N-acetylmuramoyl-L-alanine amidase [Planobispora rosea]